MAANWPSAATPAKAWGNAAKRTRSQAIVAKIATAPEAEDAFGALTRSKRKLASKQELLGLMVKFGLFVPLNNAAPDAGAEDHGRPRALSHDRAPRTVPLKNVDKFLNSASVQRKLGVPAGTTWQSCNYTVNAEFSADWMKNFQQDVPALLANGTRVLIYAGVLMQRKRRTERQRDRERVCVCLSVGLSACLS